MEQVTLSITLDDQLHKAIVSKAEEKGIRFSDFVKICLWGALTGGIAQS